MSTQLTLDDPKIKQLNQIIEENIRIQENVTPIYIDVGDNLKRIMANQNYVVFGRRGSGKSSLLLTAKRRQKKMDL